MQIETLPHVPSTEKKQYLRVATIANKTALCYLYIGDDDVCVEFLAGNFDTGISVSSLEEVKESISLMQLKEVDVIILDVPYNEKEIRDFHSYLKNRELQNVPVIYNERQLKNTILQSSDMIDDVIDLCNWQYDFSSKISFLKKAKEYSVTKKATRISSAGPARFISKRAFDIIVASILLILLLPVFLVIALAIRFESRGPIFYNAKRAGRGFKIFKFYKFRTMEVNADKKIQALAHLNQYTDVTKGPKFFKLSNDPRITRVGRFLRNTSLDELPQLFNVLKGDMSLVGNRPLPLYEAATLTTNEFVERFMAPAGITGLWQIKKRGKTDMSTEERISLDISYARNSNLMYDLWIMAHTPKALIQKTDV